MPTLSLETVVARREEPLTARVGDEIVMLEPRRSRYYGLDAIGRRVWELLEEPRSVHALCDELQDEYDVPAETCHHDVLDLLEQMEHAGLVEAR
jgi:hypothetical protein